MWRRVLKTAEKMDISSDAYLEPAAKGIKAKDDLSFELSGLNLSGSKT